MPDVQEVFRVSTQKIRPEPEALERQHGLRQITFARDTGEGPRLQVVSSSGGAATPLVPDEGVATYDAMWSPDGAQVAFSQQDGDLQNVYVLDVATGQIRMIAPGWLDGWVNGTTVLVEV